MDRFEAQLLAGVRRVGDQLAQEDGLVRIDGVDHHVQQARNVRLEGACLLRGFCRLAHDALVLRWPMERRIGAQMAERCGSFKARTSGVGERPRSGGFGPVRVGPGEAALHALLDHHQDPIHSLCNHSPGIETDSQNCTQYQNPRSEVCP